MAEMVEDGGRWWKMHLETWRGYTYILRGDRVVFRTLEDTARMDIWISGPCFGKQRVRCQGVRTTRSFELGK